MTIVLSATDAENAHHLLSELYRIRHLTVIDGQASLRIRQNDLGTFQLHHLTWGMNAEVTSGPLGQLYVGRITDGTVGYRRGRDRTSYGPGETFLAVQPDLPVHVFVDNAIVEYAVLDPELLTQVADGAPGPVRFHGYEAADAAAWLATSRYVREATAATDSPIVLATAARLLASAALAIFPNNALHDPTASDRNDAHPAALRRAVTFIDENAHRDISPADIAEAAHVTIRALRLAFRRHLGTTPTAYLRRVRLACAHTELGAADPETTTVGTVAARWGFLNHSRFTAAYHAAYGVVPSRTLRRR